RRQRVALRHGAEAPGAAGGQGARRARPEHARAPLPSPDRPGRPGRPAPAGGGRATLRRHAGPLADAPGARRDPDRARAGGAARPHRRTGPTQPVVTTGEVLMSLLTRAGLANAACAAVLALVAVLVGRRCKRPAVLHALWLLVLV